MKRRVYKNRLDIITLDSDMFGTRKRLSTGKKSDKRLLAWYEKHFEDEYTRLYEAKVGAVIADTVTFAEFGNLVLEITKDNRSSFSQKSTMTIFNNLCKYFGDTPIDMIKTTDIMRWQNSCGLASKTILNYRGYLNLIMQTAMNDDLIRKNPVQLVKAPKKVPTKSSIVYYEEDIKKLINTATRQLRAYIQLGFFTGLRGSELIALRWNGDIDFEKGIIVVDSRIREGIEDVPKSGKTRYIPMFKQARDALTEQRKRTGLSEYVFLNQYGKPYTRPDTIRKQFKEICVAAGVEIGTPHDMRRSFNTMLKQYSYPPDWILDVMGHVDESMNRNHYTGHLDVDLSKIEGVAI